MKMIIWSAKINKSNTEIATTQFKKQIMGEVMVKIEIQAQGHFQNK